MFILAVVCSLSLGMAENIELNRQLSQNVQAVRKRNYRSVQREKKRRAFFIHDYVRTKYPNIFIEGNEMYQRFMDKYPTKPDFTKTYYFRKWQQKMDQNRTCLMVPHLPILSSPDTLQRAATSDEKDTDEQNPIPQSTKQQAPQEQDTIQLNEEVIDNGVQNTDQHNETSNQFTQMSLEEIDRAVDQIVAALQADGQLQNILTDPEFDLPADVWENELAIPDDLLENELGW